MDDGSEGFFLPVLDHLLRRYRWEEDDGAAMGGRKLVVLLHHQPSLACVPGGCGWPLLEQEQLAAASPFTGQGQRIVFTSL